MNKKTFKLFFIPILTILILGFLRSPVLAADSNTPYQPYIPEDTGLADAIMFDIVAIITYVAGLGFILVSKYLNKKID